MLRMNALSRNKPSIKGQCALQHCGGIRRRDPSRTALEKDLRLVCSDVLRRAQIEGGVLGREARFLGDR